MKFASWTLLTMLALVGCTTPAPPAAEYAPQPAPYLVGAGDTLNVVVWRSPELSMTVPVTGDDG